MRPARTTRTTNQTVHRLTVEALEEREVPAAFTAGNLVVYRVGDGSTNLVNTGNPVFLDEYTPAGSFVQSLAMPATPSGPNYPLIASGTGTSPLPATLEGFLSRSVDGRFLLVPGYGSITGQATLSGTSSETVPRVVGRVDASGAVDTTTALTDWETVSTPRSVASTNGTDLWLGGATGGVRYTTLGATTSGSVSATVANVRNVEVFAGQLYSSNSSGSAVRIGAVGNGTPTTPGQVNTNLPGFPTTGSPTAYYFADLTAAVAGMDTLYVAEDTTGGGQIQKYSLASGSWVATGTAAASAVRGLTGVVSANGSVTLYGTTGTSTSTGGGSIYSFTDSTGYNGTISGAATTLVSAATRTTFRGIALTPGVAFSPASLPNGTQGAAYTQSVTVVGTNGVASFAVTGGSLPAGLTLSATGVLSGTPTGSGTSTFTVTAADASGLSASKSYSLTVNTAPNTSTTTALTSVAPLTSTFGTPVTFGGTVVAGSGASTPTGTVEIRNGGAGGTLLASTNTIGGTGANGTFSVSSTTVPVGTYSNVQAFYVPTGLFAASNSAAFGSTLTVTPPNVGTTTAVTTSNGNVVYGTQVTFTATVTAAGGTTPPTTGSVEFFDNGVTLGTTSTTATTGTGFATFTYTISPNQMRVNGGAAHTITATYTAGAGFTGSSSSGGGNAAQTITAKPLTVTGVTAANKTYDGSAAATLSTAGAGLAGVVTGDTITLNTGGATGAFPNRNAGTGLTVTVSGLTISGAATANYTLTQPTLTATIDRRPITVTAATNTRVYNATTAAAALPTVTSGSIAAGDTGVFTETYDTKDAGTGKTLTPAGSVSDGNGGLNYLVTFATDTAGAISPAGLTVTGVSASNKVYDRTTAAAVNAAGAALVGVFAGDTVNLNTGSATGTFATANAGPGITVTVAGLTISGSASGNYTLTQPTTAADITRAPLTVTGVSASNKVYDRTTAAALNLGSAALAGVISGDTVTLNTGGATGTFASANVGTGIPVTVAGLTITGAASGNYTLTQPATAADITPAPLSVTGITASNKVYDRTTAATLNTSGAALAGVIAGDTVTLSTAGAAGSFASPNVGTGVTVAVSGLSTSGASASNYSLPQPTTAANITPALVTAAGVTAATKVYDATTAAALDFTAAAPAGVIVGDTVSLDPSAAAGAFATRHVGSAIPVTISGVALSGPQAGNYALTQPTAAADITPRPLTVTATPNTKPYDGNTSAAAFPAIASGQLQGTDAAAFVETYDTPAAGTGKTLTPSGVVLDGNGGLDYSYTFVAANTGVITPSVGTTTAVGTSQATVTYGTQVTFTATVAAAAGTPAGSVAFFDDTLGIVLGAGVPQGTTATTATWTLTTAPTQLRVSTAPAAHVIRAVYTASAQFLGSSGTLAGGETVTPAGLTVTGVTANNKVYDGTTAATLTTAGAALVGVYPGDSVSLDATAAAGTFGTRNVGTGILVIVTGIATGGPQAGNYALTQPTPTADITARPLTVTALPDTKPFDGNTTAATRPAITAGTLAGGDTAAFVETYGTPNPGTNKLLTPAGTVLDGNGGLNYTVTFVATSTGTIQAVTAQSRRFDINSPANPSATAPGFTALLTTDTLAATGAGWTGPVNSYDTGNGGSTLVPELFRDFAWGTGRNTLRLAVTPGATYSLRLYVGDARSVNGGYAIQARAYDSQTAVPAFGTVTTTSGGFNTLVLSGVAAASGVVTVDLQPAPGGNGVWVLNGLDLWDQSNPANDPGSALPPPVTPTPSVVPARRFDFNAVLNPGATSAGFIGTLPTDTLSGNGAGWTSAVSAYDTGSGGGTATPLLFRDFVWGTSTQTFQFAATAGATYSVRLYVGDPRTGNGGYAIQARAHDSQATALPAFTTVTTTSGGFNVLQLTEIVATTGVVNVDVQAAPGGNGYWVVNGLDVWDQSNPANDPGSALPVSPPPTIPAVRRFDFNAGTNAGTTAAGFTGVLGTDAVGQLGYGWVTPVNTFNTGSGGGTTTPLLYQDFAWGNGRQTFQLAAATGTTYSLRLYLGDSRPNGGYAMQVRAYDSATPGGAFTTVTTTSGGFTAIVLGNVTAPSGRISVDIQAAPGGNGYWVFDGLDVWDQGGANDPGQAPQLAAVSRPAGNAPVLSDADLAPLLDAAVARWAATGLDANRLAALRSVTVRVADLSDRGALGWTGLGSSTLLLDDDAAGYGWYIDPTPDFDDEFRPLNTTEGIAPPGSAAAGRYDLLTVIEHELGHVIGLDDLTTAAAPHDLMTQYLTPGLRRGPGTISILATAPAEGSRVAGPRLTTSDVVVPTTVMVAASPSTPTPQDSAHTATIRGWFAPAAWADELDPLHLSGVRID